MGSVLVCSHSSCGGFFLRFACLFLFKRISFYHFDICNDLQADDESAGHEGRESPIVIDTFRSNLQ